MLYRSLLFIYFVYSSLYLLIPNFSFILPPPLPFGNNKIVFYVCESVCVSAQDDPIPQSLLEVRPMDRPMSPSIQLQSSTSSWGSCSYRSQFLTSAREPAGGPLVELHGAQAWWRGTARQCGQRPTARLPEMLAKVDRELHPHCWLDGTTLKKGGVGGEN